MNIIYELFVNFIDLNVIYNLLSISVFDLICMKFIEILYIIYNLYLYELNLKKKYVFYKRIKLIY